MRENERKLTLAERIRRIDPYRLRHRMVQDLGKRGITDQRVLAVMDRLPRHLFVDEALAGYCDTIKVTIHPDNSISCEDNGRGIPVDKHPKEKIPTVEVVLTILHAGGKFGGEGYKVSGGLHGVGVSVVNALSTKVEVQVRRDGVEYEIDFDHGKTKTKLHEIGKAKHTGTTVTFWPDPDIFTETTVYDYDTLAARFREMAFLNRGLKIILTDERITDADGNPRTEVFQAMGGIVDFVKFLNDGKETLNKPIYFEAENADGTVEVALQWSSSYSTNSVMAFANNINTHEGGTHMDGFKQAITRTINDYARSKGLLKEKDPNLSGEDAREGLAAIISVKLHDPQFEGQTKTKLGNTEIRPLVQNAVAQGLGEYLEELLEQKGLKRSQVVHMANLNETFGYQIFTGQRNPSRNKVLQIAFAMALSLRETNRALAI